MTLYLISESNIITTIPDEMYRNTQYYTLVKCIDLHVYNTCIYHRLQSHNIYNS